MFERFTDRSRRVVILAQQEARVACAFEIGTEHILLGLLGEGEGVAALVLHDDLGLDLEVVRKRVGDKSPKGTASVGHTPYTARAKKVLELSLREALQLGHNYIGTEHILLGLIREGEGVGAIVLVEMGADLSRVRQAVIQRLSGYAKEDLSPRPMPGSDDAVGQLAWYVKYAEKQRQRAEAAEASVTELLRHADSDKTYIRKLERDLRWAERRIEEGEL